jgi:ATP-dependent RNA helicase DeaD
MKFTEMRISERTLKSLNELNYVDATEVQEKAIPLILQGDDLMVRSQTGTGKTAAFGIGLIEIVSRDKTKKGLVLAPTRELALQIAKELAGIAKHQKLKIHAVYGGANIETQVRGLRIGYDIVIATPGRLLDHAERGTVKLELFNLVVLDEADRMLDMGFQDELNQVMGGVARERQTMMFSATFDQRIRDTAESYLGVPEFIEVGAVGKVEKINEEFVELTREQKYPRLRALLRENANAKTMIFVSTKRWADELARRLNHDRIPAREIHGDKSQNQRERTLREFKENRFNVLVATDVAARGLHIDNVEHIVNYDAADSTDTHTHRIGRTARMGKEGKATTFVEVAPMADLNSPNYGYGSSGRNYGGGHSGGYGRRDNRGQGGSRSGGSHRGGFRRSENRPRRDGSSEGHSEGHGGSYHGVRRRRGYIQVR